MAQPWQAKEEISSELALMLIQRQFPSLQAKSICFLGAGWDNTAFIVDEKMIFRFPRRECSVSLLETEKNFLPKLASHLPVAIPVPQWHGEASAQFPWPFIGYRMVEGFTACSLSLSTQEREQLAKPLAQFLAALHAVPLSVIEGSDSKSEENLERIDGRQLTLKIAKNCSELLDLGLLAHPKELEAVVAKAQDYRPEKAAHLVHGDLYVRHLLVDEKRNLAGIIDWGDAHIGDVAIDLAIAHSFLPVSAHDLFKEEYEKGYGKIDQPTWHLALLRAIFSSTYLAIFGSHTNDHHLQREGLDSLGRIAGFSAR